MTTSAAPSASSARPLPAPGHGGVDYEQRVDFDRLRRYRLDRARAALNSSECGAFLLFDFYNIRYTTQTWIGGALGDKMTRYALLARGHEPVLWDFGSAARHHQLYSPWLEPANCRAGMLGLRGAIAPRAGLMERAVREIKGMLVDLGLAAARTLEVPMPLASATAQLVSAAIGAGHTEQDFATLILEQARAAGMDLQPENAVVDDGLTVRQ